MYFFEIRVLLNLFSEATDRQTVREKVVARRIDAARAVEVQAVRAVAVKRSRPIVAVADKAQAATVGVAITRSRIPDSGSTAELAGEVHAFIGTAV